MLDAISLDELLEELRPLLVGRRLGRPRACGRDAVCFRVLGGSQLRLEAGRGRAGVYLLEPEEARALDGEEPSARTRQALLLIRKHAEGRRIGGFRRVAGERTVLLELGACVLALRLSGRAPALTLAVDGAAAATLGDGTPAWPPEPRPESEWDVVTASAVSAAVREAQQQGLRPERGILSACPALGPFLARQTDGSHGSFEDLRARLRCPRPRLLAPALPDAWTDRELAPAAALTLTPIEPRSTAGAVIETASWRSATSLFLAGRVRGDSFEAARRRAAASAAREVRRLERLASRLGEDHLGLPEPGRLRRQAEALLAALPSVPEGAGEIEVPDPYEPGRALRVRLDPSLGAAPNADRLFEKARRVERALARLHERILETRVGLEVARAREASVRSARNLGEIEPPALGGRESGAEGWTEPRHYLTKRGLSVLAGRGARENHRLTFAVARPEDLWLHALDVPGAHVVLRDPEGRAEDQDVREAAEVAAWFSASRGAATVDVHVARRKHLRAFRGSPGRVHIGHSETVRVSPRDPEGRLRRRGSRKV